MSVLYAGKAEGNLLDKEKRIFEGLDAVIFAAKMGRFGETGVDFAEHPEVLCNALKRALKANGLDWNVIYQKSKDDERTDGN